MAKNPECHYAICGHCSPQCDALIESWVAMLRTVVALIGVSLLSGCVVSPFSSLTDRTRQIWDEYGPPPSTLAAPKGFKVTPAEAYMIVAGGERQKFGLYIYADRTHYYLAPHVPLQIPTSGYARMYGVQVDGTTGACFKCKEHRVAPPNNAVERTRDE
jgi:hypothetical protein